LRRRNKSSNLKRTISRSKKLRLRQQRHLPRRKVKKLMLKKKRRKKQRKRKQMKRKIFLKPMRLNKKQKQIQRLLI